MLCAYGIILKNSLCDILLGFLLNTALRFAVSVVSAVVVFIVVASVVIVFVVFVPVAVVVVLVSFLLLSLLSRVYEHFKKK